MSCLGFFCCNDVINKFEKGTKMPHLKEVYIDKIITVTDRNYKPSTHTNYNKIVYDLHDVLHQIIIDKDIKPSNILLVRNAIAKLAGIDDWFDYDGDLHYTDDEIVKGAKYLLVKKFILC